MLAAQLGGKLRQQRVEGLEPALLEATGQGFDLGAKAPHPHAPGQPRQPQGRVGSQPALLEERAEAPLHARIPVDTAGADQALEAYQGAGAHIHPGIAHPAGEVVDHRRLTRAGHHLEQARVPSRIDPSQLPDEPRAPLLCERVPLVDPVPGQHVGRGAGGRQPHTG